MGSADVGVIRGGFEAFAHGDVPAVLALLDPATEWTEPAGSPWGGAFRGHGEVAGLFATAAARPGPRWRVVPEELVPTGRGVLALGRHTGDGPDGSWQVPFAMVFDMHEGLVVRVCQYGDSVLMRQAAGEPVASREKTGRPVRTEGGR
ncbi:MAG: nuclear transport factor 2 family protein, partial [Thermoleophilia bacterium]|nr:nuclear transport factor 2 family protein [Thermoleophilia bacterium]